MNCPRNFDLKSLARARKRKGEWKTKVTHDSPLHLEQPLYPVMQNVLNIFCASSRNESVWTTHFAPGLGRKYGHSRRGGSKLDLKVFLLMLLLLLVIVGGWRWWLCWWCGAIYFFGFWCIWVAHAVDLAGCLWTWAHVLTETWASSQAKGRMLRHPSRWVSCWKWHESWTMFDTATEPAWTVYMTYINQWMAGWNLGGCPRSPGHLCGAATGCSGTDSQHDLIGVVRCGATGNYYLKLFKVFET